VNARLAQWIFGFMPLKAGLRSRAVFAGSTPTPFPNVNIDVTPLGLQDFPRKQARERNARIQIVDPANGWR
jgi:hypothetical protein